MKKYIKTIEDLLALKDTDKKIYIGDGGYYHCKFVNGFLCKFFDNGDIWYNTDVCIGENSEVYTLEEDPIEEAGCDDVGKLCYFWNEYEKLSIIRFLICVDEDTDGNTRFWYGNREWMKHCRVLTEEDFKKIQNKEGE